MNKKISILLIVTIALIIVIIGGVFAYQYYFSKFQTPDTKSQTAGWQTYANNQYGFEIKYPSDWEDCGVSGKFILGIIPPINTSDILAGTSRDVYKGYSCGYGSFQIAQEEEYNSIIEMKDYIYNFYKENDCQPESMIKEIEFNGLSALRIESCDPSGEYAGESIIFEHDQKILQINFSDILPKVTVDQILFTFRFTK